MDFNVKNVCNLFGEEKYVEIIDGDVKRMWIYSELSTELKAVVNSFVDTFYNLRNARSGYTLKAKKKVIQFTSAGLGQADIQTLERTSLQDESVPEAATSPDTESARA